MCANRSGVVKKLKARKAELLKLRNSGYAISWNNSVKLHAEVVHIKNKEERYSRVPRLSDTRYSKGNGDMQATKRD